MDKRELITLVLILTSTLVNCQVYLDSTYNRVEKENAYYYQKYEDITDSSFVLKTFLMNNVLIMEEHLKYSDIKKKDIEIRDGYYYEFFQSGSPKYIIEYKNGKLNGELKGFYEDGKLRRNDYYKDDKLVNGRCFTKMGLDTTYYIYRKAASYKNLDLTEYRDYIQRRLRYPGEAIEKEIWGRVIVKIEIETDGSVKTEIIRSPDQLLGNEVIKTILKAVPWEPAIFEGEKVKQAYILPFIFML